MCEKGAISLDGLKKIQDRILEQAQDKAAEIAARAQEQCESIIEQAQLEQNRILSETRAKAQAQADAVLNRARSLAAMEKRKNILQKKQKLIDRVIDQALIQVCSMPADKKLELYESMIRRTGAINGVITLSADDLPLGGQLISKLGSGFELSDIPGSFAGGLVLLRGRIEDNLTFDLIVRNHRPQLSATAASALSATAALSDEE
jgi:V/A-type H+-transporting ATPase subunit E